MAELDARGLKCPLPVLRARKALKGLSPGEEITVFATDRAAPRDFAAFCEESGHRLLSCNAEAGEYRIVIRRQ